MNHHAANNTMNHHQPSPPIINTTTTNASSSSPRCFQIPTLFPDEQQIVLAQFARDQFSQNGSVCSLLACWVKQWAVINLLQKMIVHYKRNYGDYTIQQSQPRAQTQIDTQYNTQRPAQVWHFFEAEFRCLWFGHFGLMHLFLIRFWCSSVV